MSIIPKISVGLPKKREKRNLNFDCSTTLNIGNIQPTMCREMVPNEKYTVKVSSLVRLASMPLPTFGRLSLRHHHVFVPYEYLWQPFDAMLAGQHYSSSAQSYFIPTSVPFFRLNESLMHFIVSYSDITFYNKTDLASPLKIDLKYDDQGNLDIDQAQINALGNAYDACRRAAMFDGATADAKLFEFGVGSSASDGYGRIFAGDFLVNWSMADLAAMASASTPVAEWSVKTPSNPDGRIVATDAGVVTLQGADLITTCGNYVLMFKFRPLLKRLRTIFIGLGWQFTPYNDLDQSCLKLLAYYKAWFALFRPQREKNFVDTNCYKFIKFYSERNGQNVSSVGMWLDFLKDLAKDCFYYLPMDYFGMSVVKPTQDMQDTSVILDAGVSRSLDANGQGGTMTVQSDQVRINSTSSSVYGTPSVAMASGTPSPVVVQLAMRLLRFANKNTVIGRNIRDYIKAHYGVESVDPFDSGEVTRIGSSRVNINISDVMSTAENSEGYLGEYGGKGIGYGDSDTFTYETKKFGVWITLTTVVPESGYYQGYLLENRHLTRFQFFTPEFDALGYQLLERGEIMDDYNCDTDAWKPKTNYKRNYGFGFVPRYSEYKVGRNIVNGDLSLIGLYNSMAPYTLDRRISGGKIVNARINSNGDLSAEIEAPDFVPTVVYDDFRKIDPSDHLGQYNRIFNYGGNDLDHFIIHNIFDVKATAPMKSLSTSFDTYSEEDDTSMNVVKA